MRPDARPPGPTEAAVPSSLGAVPVLAVVLLVVGAFALAGCIGSSEPGGPTQQDAASNDGGDDAGGDGSGDGGTSDGDAASGSGDGNDSDADGEDDGTDPPPRTPDGFMPDRDPVETGEGWAKFEVQGTASLAVDSFVLFTFLDDRYSYDIVLEGDETLIEGVLTWNSEMADLGCVLGLDRGGGARCTEHGMVFREPTGSNGSVQEHLAIRMEHIDLDPDNPNDFPMSGNITVIENEVWEPTAAPGEADGSLSGLEYTLEIWVHTVPAEPSHNPFTSA